MENPLHRVPMLHPAVPEGTFRRAFVKGAGSGALMMGIFSGVLQVAQFVGITALVGMSAPALPAVIGMMGLGSIATGLFSGVMASQRSVSDAASARHQSHAVVAAAREPVRAPEQAIAHATQQGSAWQEKVGAQRGHGRERVAAILADGKLSDKDRATAILRERSEGITSEAIR